MPSVNHLRMASGTVAVKVAQTAYEEGLSTVKLANPVQDVFEAMWQPRYPEILLPEGEWRDFDDERARQRYAGEAAGTGRPRTPPARPRSVRRRPEDGTDDTRSVTAGRPDAGRRYPCADDDRFDAQAGLAVTTGSSRCWRP